MRKTVEAAGFVLSFEPPTFFQVSPSLPEEHLCFLSPPKATGKRLIQPSIYPLTSNKCHQVMLGKGLFITEHISYMVKKKKKNLCKDQDPAYKNQKCTTKWKSVILLSAEGCLYSWLTGMGGISHFW